MKTFFLSTLAAALAVAGSTVAQTGSPPVKRVQFTSTARDTNVVNNGLVFYCGQTFLVRNGRAAAISTPLLAEGEILTLEGTRVPLPKNFGDIRSGLFRVNGDTYLLRNGTITAVNAKLIPEGHVLTADNRLMPLPSDFSGFVLDRAPDGSVLPTPPAQSGPQALSGQAGISQTPIPATKPTSSSQLSLDTPRSRANKGASSKGKVNSQATVPARGNSGGASDSASPSR